MATSDPRAWYDVAFAASYPILYAHRDDRSAASEVDFVLRNWQLEGPTRILDLCSGDGRHSRALSSRGHLPIGLDRSPQLLAVARRAAATPLVRSDMRALPLADGSVGAVASFFTSFGYFESPAEDRVVLEECRRVLRPRGRFILDFLDAATVRRTLVPESRRRVGDVVLDERISGDRVLKRVVAKNAAGIVLSDYEERVRLYEPEEIVGMITGAGFTIDASFGDFDGREAGTGTRRINFATRAS